jgi:hypothetical protein
MVEVLVDYISTLPEDAVVLVAGDFNVYTSTEPGYQLLINPNRDLVLKDPINVPGSWNNNAQFSDVHTQSTRTAPINDDGAGGGMDDRFDFILISEPAFEADARVQYVEGTYENVGNTGNCFNQRLIDCTGGNVPGDVVYAMYQMSDHLPIVLEMQVQLPEPTYSGGTNASIPALYGGNMVHNRLYVSATGKDEIQGGYRIMDSRGQEVYRGATGPTPSLDIYTGMLSKGMYLLVFDSQNWKPFRFLKW